MPARLAASTNDAELVTARRFRGHSVQPCAAGSNASAGSTPSTQDRAHVGEQATRARQAAGDAAVRVGERGVRDDRRARGVEQQPQREEDRRADARVVELDGEPRAARGDRIAPKRLSGRRADATTPHATSAHPTPARARLEVVDPPASEPPGSLREIASAPAPSTRPATQDEQMAQPHAAHPLTTPRAAHQGVPLRADARSAGTSPMCAPRPRHSFGTSPSQEAHDASHPSLLQHSRRPLPRSSSPAAAAAPTRPAASAARSRRSSPSPMATASPGRSSSSPTRCSSAATGRCGSTSRTTGARTRPTTRPA